MLHFAVQKYIPTTVYTHAVTLGNRHIQSCFVKQVCDVTYFSIKCLISDQTPCQGKILKYAGPLSIACWEYIKRQEDRDHGLLSIPVADNGKSKWATLGLAS